jgi:hypothetical protein
MIHLQVIFDAMHIRNFTYFSELEYVSQGR